MSRDETHDTNDTTTGTTRTRRTTADVARSGRSTVISASVGLKLAEAASALAEQQQTTVSGLVRSLLERAVEESAVEEQDMM